MSAALPDGTIHNIVAWLAAHLNEQLQAYSVPFGAGGSLAGTAAADLAFPVAGGVWDVDAADAGAEGA